MDKFERIVEINPAFDRRHVDPKKNYGVHGCSLKMILKGKKGAMQFVLYTGWHLKHVAEEFKAKGINDPLSANVWYHSPHPMYEGQSLIQDGCPYLDGKPCYYDGSGLYAEEAFKVLVEGGSEKLWSFLEDEYNERFGK